MRFRVRGRFALVATVAILVCASAPAVSAAQDRGASLSQYIRASKSDIRRLERGEVVTTTLDGPDGREVTSFGTIRVHCTPEVFAARVRDIERFKASEYVLQIGRFQAPPTIQDVTMLTLDPDDRESMRECRPGSCGLRLPAAEMDRFRTTIPWGKPGEIEAAGAAMRQFLVDEARTYLAEGSPALPTYADRPKGVPRALAFRQLLRPSAFPAEYQPDLFRFLDEFPRTPLEGAESILYWSREKFGLKPVISITHTVLRRRDGLVAFASKQVYVSHYFDASLGMALFLPEPGTSYGYVTYMNRSRVEALHGILAPLARRAAARRGREGLGRVLMDVKRKLEQP